MRNCQGERANGREGGQGWNGERQNKEKFTVEPSLFFCTACLSFGDFSVTSSHPLQRHEVHLQNQKHNVCSGEERRMALKILSKFAMSSIFPFFPFLPFCC